MSILIKETQGDTLGGVIDGANVHYTTTFQYAPDSVQVYVNGQLKVQAWDDGFVVLGGNLVALKEPLLVGDTLEIEYQANVKTGGGALGGIPEMGISQNLKPESTPDQQIPGTLADTLEPGIVSRKNDPTTLSTDVRPVMIKPREV